MRALLHFLLVLPIASCSFQQEKMGKGHPEKGTTYSYTMIQVGGQAAAESSSGTKLAAFNEASFQAFCNLVGISVLGWTQASIAKAKEISAQFYNKQITLREAQAQAHELAKYEAALKGAATSEAIQKGAPVAPITLTPLP